MSEGGGSEARPGISNRLTEGEDQPRPEQQAEQRKGQSESPLETQRLSAWLSHRYRFTWRHVSTRAEHTTLSEVAAVA